MQDMDGLGHTLQTDRPSMRRGDPSSGRGSVEGWAAGAEVLVVCCFGSKFLPFLLYFVIQVFTFSSIFLSVFAVAAAG